jgi:hypothetical protein
MNADNPFEPFFGPVSVQDNQNVRADDVFSHETFNLPKAYEGKNLHLQDVIDFLVTREDDWYTSRVLPWKTTDQLSIKWNIFRFNKTMMDLEPHQGVPRYVTAESESRQDRLVRRGLAFIIEHGFFSTEEGRRHYMYNLEQITSAVHETCFFGVLHSLLAGKNHYREWNRQYGRRVNRVSDLLSLERHRFAICQKSERGLYLLDAELKDAMKYNDVYPDTWIFPSKLSIYVSMVPSTEVSYQEVGRSDAVAKNNDISAAPQKLLTFRGCTVHETRPFDMDFSGHPQELLRREAMIGSYMTMLPHARPDKCNYTTDDRSIWIYNMNVDRFEKVQIEDAIKHSFRFEKGDEFGGVPHAAHASILYDLAMPSTREVSKRDDPMFCHKLETDIDAEEDAVVKYFGDLQLHHFTEQDMRDWANSLICSIKSQYGADKNVTKEIYESMVGAANLDSVIMEKNEDGEANLGAPRAIGVTADPDIVRSLENAWDPVLAAALHNNVYPSNVALRSQQSLQRQFNDEFPQTWKNLITPSDMTYARKQVVKKASSLRGDSLANFLEKVNDHYAEHLTERVLSNRSALQSGGLMDLALNEMTNPKQSSRRSKAQKRVDQFVANFESTAEYFKRENPELMDNQHVMREIVRDFIQPLHARDALEMESRIETAVMNGETVTPDMLKESRQNLSSSRQESNMRDMAEHLESSAADLSKVADGAPGSEDKRSKASYRPGSETSSAYGLTIQTETRKALGKDGYRGTIDMTAEMKRRKQIIQSYGGDMQKAMEFFLATKVTEKTLLKMAENNLIIPFGFILQRPFQRYDMCSAILCKSGSKLGNTYIGHNDFQLTDDVIHKTHIGHYTFYSKSIIHDEKQYQIAENVFGAGYKGGEDTRFYREKEELLDDVHAESFRASIIAMMVPYRTNGGSDAPTISNPLDITGALHPTLYADTDIPEGHVKEAQFPGARYYAEFLELKRLTSYASEANEYFMSPFKYLNTVCFQGAQFMYNPKQGAFVDKISNSGHWGNTYNGCAKVRNGENAFLREDPQLTPLG